MKTLRAIPFLLVGLAASPAFADGDVRLWVTYQNNSQKASVRSTLQGLGATIKREHDAARALAVTVPEAKVASVKAAAHVTAVETDPRRHLTGLETPWGIDAVQAPLVWDVDGNGALDPSTPAGADVVVCIIDTGVTRNHPDLAGISFVGGYPETGDPATDWRTDTDGHGTHVAGTIAAQLNGAGVVGVAPRAALYIVRLDFSAGIFSSDVVAAVGRCQAAGADVVSMSLGGSGYSATEDAAYQDFFASGMLLVASSGNDFSMFVNYPAGYPSVISVAAADPAGHKAAFSNADEFVDLAAPGTDVLSTAPRTRTSRLDVGGVSYDLQMLSGTPLGTVSGKLVNGGRCAPATFDTPLSFPGAIVICRYDNTSVGWRGWVANLAGSGAVAQIVATGLDYTGEIGADDAGQIEDGMTSLVTTRVAIDLLTRRVGQTATLTNAYDPTTPGYAVLSGTSMAAPHAAGVAALVWSHHPSRSNADIRAALTATARSLRPAPLPPRRTDDFGAGLVQALAAIDYLRTH